MKLQALVSMVGFVCGVAACGGGGGDGSGPPPAVATVSVSPATASILVGQTQQLTAATKDAGGNTLTGRTVTWGTNNAAVATVSTAGLVSAVGGGNATITATSEGVDGMAAVASQGFTILTEGVGAALPATAAGESKYFTIDVPNVRDSLVVRVYVPQGGAGSGDPNLAVYTNTSLATTVCSGAIVGADRCRVVLPPNGTYAIKVSANSAFSGYEVSAEHDGPFLVKSISAGGYHTCALTDAGAAYCWGSNGSGELGNDSSTFCSPCAPVLPGAVVGGLTFATLTAGTIHTCGLTSSGTAYCWGNNGWGQVGDGTQTDRFKPTLVSGGLIFTSLSAGDHYTCGIATGGLAYCWGANYQGTFLFGWLGDGTSADHHTPEPVSGGGIFTSITAGFMTTCALANGGAAYCWGANGSGEVGDGSYFTNRTTPVAVLGGLTFTSIVNNGFATGGSNAHTCGLTPSGAAYCWGNNNGGQLGDGTQATYSATPAAVTGGLTFTGLSAGFYYTCGIRTGGTAYCWGSGTSGELGDGNMSGSRSAPGAPVAGGKQFSSLSGGLNHTCGRTTAGAAYCWGNNYWSQIGDGTTTDRAAPVPVPSP